MYLQDTVLTAPAGPTPDPPAPPALLRAPGAEATGLHQQGSGVSGFHLALSHSRPRSRRERGWGGEATVFLPCASLFGRRALTQSCPCTSSAAACQPSFVVSLLLGLSGPPPPPALLALKSLQLDCLSGVLFSPTILTMTQTL